MPTAGLCKRRATTHYKVKSPLTQLEQKRKTSKQPLQTSTAARRSYGKTDHASILETLKKHDIVGGCQMVV